MAFRMSLRRKPLTFSPPLAMQESVWNSILNGDFIDAKILAFSRNSPVPGRVDTPKALFVNTRVLATACSYFDSIFSSSDGVETDLNAGSPPTIEPSSELGEWDLESDFDDPIEDNPTNTQPRVPLDTLEQLKRPIKAYLVKDIAYRTLRAIIWYIYSGEISFSNDSSEAPSASAMSVYRFADEHRMDHLKALASEAIDIFINKLSPTEVVEEACSVSCNAFTTRYPEWSAIYVERLYFVLTRNWDAKCAFRDKIFAYFKGSLPHCKGIITSTILCLLNNSVIHKAHRGNWTDGSEAILRVSNPWPEWTKEAVRTSLDTGSFDGFELSISDGPGAISHPVYAPLALMDDESKGSLGLLSYTSSFSIRTWQALVYYKYTGCIIFLAFGSELSAEQPLDENLSDPQFQGYPCSVKEMYDLALQLGYSEMTRVTTEQMLSSLALGNVIEGMFSGSPIPGNVIRKGVKIIRGSEDDEKFGIFSQLHEILDEAASGSRSQDLKAFLACFDELTPRACPDLDD